MDKIKRTSAISCMYTPLIAILLVGGNVSANEETLECTLYSGESMTSEVMSSVEIKDADLMLESNRVSALRVFEDGRVADKQYVVISRGVGDGSTGTNMGYSVYTMENGASLSAQFTGEWGSDGFNGVYMIMGGTGNFEGAIGDGTVTGAESPWATTGIVDIVLNVKTP